MANKQFAAQSIEMSKVAQRLLEEERRVNATVFEYDEVWDKMQEAKARQKAAKEADATERKVSVQPLPLSMFHDCSVSADILKPIAAEVH